MQACSFTGHRPEKLPFRSDESHPDCARLKQVIAAQIERLYRERSITKYFAGGAIGVDTSAAEEVIRFRTAHSDVKLHIIVPFRGQTDRFSPEQRRKYQKILKAADIVTVMQEHYTGDCFFRRNDMLVERADVLIAVYDSTGRSRSGMSYTVNRAIETGKHILFIHPVTHAISYHVGTKQSK